MEFLAIVALFVLALGFGSATLPFLLSRHLSRHRKRPSRWTTASWCFRQL